MSDQPIPDPGQSDPDIPTQTNEGGGRPIGSGTPRMPKRIGQYALKRVIASGGMGTVYEAVQEHPRRTVALKVMKHGIASRSALRRFEYESQILARLRHPGIAQVFEAGTHDDGTGAVPYFAMEYIPSPKTITEYARAKKLGTRERLQLFVQVCEAVNHGHQKGIIHRDLKPANILVDSHGQAKIIDFGVARATDSDLAVTTLQTDVGQLIGTVQYMSPEQCEADPHDLDTRSDVYALGVVLYELLCEHLPYDVGRVAVYEAARVIREQPPTKLSTIDRTLRGDVETIALKALEKDRERRYQSADELRRDIDHYLQGEPISARPPSVVYQLRIFARRNKGLVGGVAAAFVVLFAGVVVSTSMYFRAEHARIAAVDARIAESRQREIAEAARNEADQARGAEEEQRKSAEANAERARQEAAKAKAVNTFLHEMLASVDPIRFGVSSVPGRDGGGLAVGGDTPARDTKVADLLLQATQKVEQAFADQPELKAQVRNTLGMTFHGLGMFEQAEAQLVKALEIRRRLCGEKHLETLRTRANLGTMYHMQQDALKAEPHLRAAAQGLGKILGEQHPDTVAAKLYWGFALSVMGRFEEGRPLIEGVLEVRRRELGEEHRSTIEAMCWLSMALYVQGKFWEAEPIARQAHQVSLRILGPNDWYTAVSATFLGVSLAAQGQYAEGEPLVRQGVEGSRRVLGEEHPYTRFFAEGLAQTLMRQGKLAEAREFVAGRIDVARRCAERPTARAEDIHAYARLLVTCEPAGLRDPATALPLAQRAVDMTDGKNAWMLDTLAEAYRQTGDLDRAIRTQERAIAERSPNDLAHLLPLNMRYLILLLDAGRDAEADQVLGTLFVAFRLMLGKQNPMLPTALNFLGTSLANAGHNTRAIRLYRQALELSRRIHGDDSPEVADILANLAVALEAQGKLDEAIDLFERVLAMRRRASGDANTSTLYAMNSLAWALRRTERLDEAEALAREALAGFVGRFGRESGNTIMVADTLAVILHRQGKLDEAAATFADIIATGERSLGGDNPLLPEIRIRYGQCLADMGEREEAERQLTTAYDDCRRIVGDDDDLTHQAIDSLINLYETWGKPNKAAEWRVKLPPAPESQPTTAPAAETRVP